jgi:hypothetical protein
MEMRDREQPGDSGASPSRRLRPLLGALTLLLALGAAAPARATTTFSSGTTTINYSITDNVAVNGTAVMNVVAGGSISGTVVVGSGGTLYMSGGTIAQELLDAGGTVVISGGVVSAKVGVVGGAVNIFGGTISGGVVNQGGIVSIFGGSILGETGSNQPFPALAVQAGSTVSIFGGSISGNVNVLDGKLNVFGCNLLLSGSTLSGKLEDGTPTNMRAVLVTPPAVLNLDNVCASSHP